MSEKDTQQSTVTDLTKKREEKKEKEHATNPDGGYSFEETVRRNKENAERLRKERLKDNKKVKRDYRLT